MEEKINIRNTGQLYRRYFFCLFFLLFFLSFSTKAQEDLSDIEVDTVYIDEPVIIKKQVILPKEKKKPTGVWYLSFAAKYSTPSILIDEDNYSFENKFSIIPELSIGRYYKTWDAGLGISYCKIEGHARFVNQKNGKDTSVYVPINISLLQAPFGFKRKYYFEQWIVRLGFDLVPAVIINQGRNTDAGRIPDMRQFFLNGSINGSFGLKVSKKFTTELVVDYSRNLIGLVKQTKGYGMSVFGGGLRLNYFF